VMGVGTNEDRAAVSVHVLLGGVRHDNFHNKSVRRCRAELPSGCAADGQ
jgi:hypothetical protein